MKRSATLFFCRLVMATLTLKARSQIVRARLETRRLRRRLVPCGLPTRRYYLQVQQPGKYLNSPKRWITVHLVEAWTREEAEQTAKMFLLGRSESEGLNYRLVPERPINVPAA